MVQHTLIQTEKQAQTSTPIVGGLLHRKCDECRKKKPLLQRSTSGLAFGSVPPIVHEVLRSPGSPLDAMTRAFMEPRFGHDFSRVRVHTDAKAAESARAVNALAYTVGRDVVFGAGQHAPQSGAGQSLMAHELTHVVQQGHQVPVLQTLTMGSQAGADEQEAETASRQISSGFSIQIPQALSSSLLQRMVACPATLKSNDTIPPGWKSYHGN